MARLAFGVAVAIIPRHARGQHTHPLSLEATVGESFGRGGGLRRYRDGVAFDGLLGWRVRPLGPVHTVLAVGVGAQGPYAGDDSCLPAPGGGCVRDFPIFYSVGVLVGVEHLGRLGSLRVLAGPTRYQADGNGDGYTLGGQARLELATPPFHHVALLGSVRGGLIPSLDAERYGLVAWGLGLRAR